MSQSGNGGTTPWREIRKRRPPRSDDREREGMWCVDQISGERPFYTMDGDLARSYVKWLEDGGWTGIRLQQFTCGEWLKIDAHAF